MIGRRILAAVIAAGSVFALGTNPAPAQVTEVDKWTQLADQAYAESVDAVAKADAARIYVRAQFVAPLAWYAGQRFGWQDARTQAWLTRLYSLQTPTKGYGVGVSWDPHSDGTFNPASTAYTITSAYHVGSMLIAGLEAKELPVERVREVADWLMRLPLAAGGKCAAYSEHRYDTGKPCIWNISATAAWFLWKAHQLQVFPDAQEPAVIARIRSWRDHVRANYRRDLGAWTYDASSNVRQSSWYNVATVHPMIEADPTIGFALTSHFGIWPVTAANAELLPFACNRADANYPAIRDVITRPRTNPMTDLQNRAGFTPLLLLVAAKCIAPMSKTLAPAPTQG